jgi:hypothetical protein
MKIRFAGRAEIIRLLLHHIGEAEPMRGKTMGQDFHDAPGGRGRRLLRTCPARCKAERLASPALDEGHPIRDDETG